MSEINREGGRWGGDGAAGQPTPWDVDRAALWSWVDGALAALPASTLDATALKSLCAHVLETHAPAALVDAQAAGIALEHLVAARIVDAYGAGHTHTRGRYDVGRIRRIVRTLGDRAAPAA